MTKSIFQEITMLIGQGYINKYLTEAEIRALLRQVFSQIDLARKRVLVIIPDSTRTAPLPQMFRFFYEYLGETAADLDYLIALGTHRPMSGPAVNKLLGLTAAEQRDRYPKVHIFNHRWDHPDTFVSLGQIPETEIEEITGGLMRQAVDVQLNKMILDYDQLFICGPTFPHEVVGFSGGNKYFFPGIGGPDIINFTHWLGAVITSYEVIGTKHTPVRQVIDKAAALIPKPKLCFSMVVKEEDLAGLFIGTPEEAYESAADLSAKLHIKWVDQPYHRALAVMPTLYDDIWTAAKGMYKTEPAIAAGGEVIIYAPHIDEISYTHGKLLDEIGYHVRDYFLKQWDKFKHYPGGVLAHSTHLRGIGSYDPATGIETPRIKVTLATRIPEERCRRLNLGYLDPDTINLDEWRNRKNEGILLIPRAGEILYRLKTNKDDHKTK